MVSLAIHWNVDPVMFHLGPLAIRWYGLLFISGFILGWYIFRWFFRREGIKEELLDPLLYTLLIATIVGARLGHCCFYQPDYYFGSWAGFWEIFMPWKGGLASHGGALALLLGMWCTEVGAWLHSIEQTTVLGGQVLLFGPLLLVGALGRLPDPGLGMRR